MTATVIPCIIEGCAGYLKLDPKTEKVSCSLCGRIHEPIRVGGRLL